MMSSLSIAYDGSDDPKSSINYVGHGNSSTANKTSAANNANKNSGGSSKSKDTKDYVLSKFNKEETNILDSRNDIINNIINDFIANNTKEIIMGKYNGIIL